jgi:hypothetical protein
MWTWLKDASHFHLRRVESGVYDLEIGWLWIGLGLTVFIWSLV